MMTPMPAWDRTNQMPGERPFEAYHMRDTTAQPRIIHSHEFYEIYFFVSGRIRIVTEEVDVCPRRGDVLVFPPHCMHRNIHLSAEEPYERFYLYASRAFVQSITGCGAELSACLDTLVQEKGLLFHLHDAALETLMQATDEVISASEQTAPEDALMNQYRMAMLLLQTTASLKSGSTAAQQIPQSRMNPILRYLNDHALEDVSLDHLADTFFISKYALLREFKAYTGITIHQYVLAKRILKAQELLMQGEKPYQVGELCGFSDYTCFYRAFRNRTGMSPVQYSHQHHA